MKIDKAIETLQRSASDGIPRGETGFNDAVKLGIEALKEIRRNRPVFITNVSLLPGETK